MLNSSRVQSCSLVDAADRNMLIGSVEWGVQQWSLEEGAVGAVCYVSTCIYHTDPSLALNNASFFLTLSHDFCLKFGTISSLSPLSSLSFLALKNT